MPFKFCIFRGLAASGRSHVTLADGGLFGPNFQDISCARATANMHNGLKQPTAAGRGVQSRRSTHIRALPWRSSDPSCSNRTHCPERHLLAAGYDGLANGLRMRRAKGSRSFFHTAAARRATRVAPRTVLSGELPMRKLGTAADPYVVGTNPSNASRKAVAQGLQGLF